MSKQLEDIVGKIYGELTVLQFSYTNNYGAYWECQCSCNKKKVIRGTSLKSGNTRTCGCNQGGLGNTTHGDYGTRFYNIWIGIIKRTTPYTKAHNTKTYKHVTISNAWKDYIQFRKDMYEDYIEHIKLYGKKDTTIDRKDGNKEYSLENCRWATIKEQRHNRR